MTKQNQKPSADDLMSMKEPYHPDKVWTWPKEEQERYQERIQPLLSAALEAEEKYTLDQLETIADMERTRNSESDGTTAR